MSDKAKQLRDEAADLYRKADESFNRCDTDGFMSQWAHTINAQRKELEACLEENYGQAEFAGLFEGDRRVDARLIHGRHGLVWILSEDEEARYGRKFIPFDDSHHDPELVCWERSRSRVQIGLGLHQQLEWAPARIVTEKSSYHHLERTDGK